jgi:predicted GIY-YIG superfamily endonuclease
MNTDAVVFGETAPALPDLDDRYAPERHVITNMRPHGMWVRNRVGAAQRVHMVGLAFADWTDGPLKPRVITRCGTSLRMFRFEIEPSDTNLLCDWCVLADVRPPTVYRLFDASGRLLYVGYTNDPIARLKSHSCMSPWWPAVANVQLTHFRTYREGIVAERSAIETEDPIHNVQYVGRPFARKRVPS